MKLLEERIEKGFQQGGQILREKDLQVESLAIVESMNHETGEIVFRQQYNFSYKCRYI